MHNFRGCSIFSPTCQVKSQIRQLNVMAGTWAGASASDPRLEKCSILKQSRSRLCTPSAKWGRTNKFKPRIKSPVKCDNAHSKLTSSLLRLHFLNRLFVL